MQPTPEQLEEILRLHKAWRDDPTQRQRANLRGADLRGTNLREADLWAANLSEADLREADLWGANLRGANLRGANLRGANLQKANLQKADLQKADLWEANLRGANIKNVELPHFAICPSEGSFVAWKAVMHGIAKIEIPARAKRTSCLINRKCRASYVKTLAIYPASREARGRHDRTTVYRVGRITRADKFCDDVRLDCSHGIHCFMTRREAEEWNRGESW